MRIREGTSSHPEAMARSGGSFAELGVVGTVNHRAPASKFIVGNFTTLSNTDNTLSMQLASLVADASYD